MITRGQQILLKRAQREVAIEDAEYREAIQIVSGMSDCASSKDARLTDEHLDKLLSYFEAIYFRKVDSGELQASCKPNAVFRQRRFWAQKNTRSETSRDRYVGATIGSGIAHLESRLAALGFGAQYCAAIRQNVFKGRSGAGAEHLYKAALERTLRSKEKKPLAVDPAAQTIRT